MNRTISLLLFCFFSAQWCLGQAEISSSNGWTATIEIIPVAAVPRQNNCPWFYNYNVKFDYHVTFHGDGPNKAFNAQLYFICSGGTGGELYKNLGRISGDEMGTATTNNNARQYTAQNEAYDYGDNPDCNEVDVYDINCNSVRMEYWGNGIESGSITFNTGTGPLPIELYDFSAEVKEYGVILKWITLSELNNDFFLIEKSTNGENWYIVNTVNGAGTTASMNEYSMIDTEQEGVTYYRLTQVDFDGKREIFDPIAVAPLSHATMEQPYPNPADDMLFIPGLGDSKTLRIIDIQGQLIEETRYERKGEALKVGNLDNGIYFFEIFGAFEGKSYKVVIRH